MLGADGIRKELGDRSQTAKPYNVNFFCHNQPKPDPERDRYGASRWHRTSPSSEST